MKRILSTWELSIVNYLRDHIPNYEGLIEVIQLGIIDFFDQTNNEKAHIQAYFTYGDNRIIIVQHRFFYGEETYQSIYSNSFDINKPHANFSVGVIAFVDEGDIDKIKNTFRWIENVSGCHGSIERASRANLTPVELRQNLFSIRCVYKPESE